MNTMFIFTFFQIFLFENRLVLRPAHQVPDNERIEFSVKKKKTKKKTPFGFCGSYLELDCLTNLVCSK